MMSISGIAPDPTAYQNYAASPFQQVRKDFASLKTSLTSGDLTGAQKAFTALTQDLQTIQSGQQAGAGSLLENDLAAIGNALQSNDLAGAQKALATLTQDMQKVRQSQGGRQGPKALHHRHGNSAQSATSNPFSDLAAIAKALQAGDLARAQNAFAALTQDLGNTSSQNAAATPGTDLAAIGNALQAGDLAGAQNAFAMLMQDLQRSIATLGNGTNTQTVGANIDVAT
jgi:hypothetical protein